MHPRLERQVRAQFGSLDAAPAGLDAFLHAIDVEYRAADDDRALLEKAMALSSEELVKRNIELTGAYARLQELDSFRTQFINNAAHELGTPLTPIKIQVHLLKQALSEDVSPQTERSIATLQRNLDRLADLVRDVLDAARLQSDRFKLELAPFDLLPVVNDVVDTYEPQATQAGVKLRADLPASALAHVNGDPRRVSQVLFNLVSNALKFTPEGGEVRVVVRGENTGATVLVTDSGAGIDPLRLADLFRPFSQVHDTMQSTKGGTGLGLYISKGIVEGCGGRIWAESPGKGAGATFAFTLPRA